MQSIPSELFSCLGQWQSQGTLPFVSFLSLSFLLFCLPFEWSCTWKQQPCPGLSDAPMCQNRAARSQHLCKSSTFPPCQGPCELPLSSTGCLCGIRIGCAYRIHMETTLASPVTYIHEKKQHEAAGVWVVLSKGKRSRILHRGRQQRTAVAEEGPWRWSRGKVWEVMGSMVYLGDQIVIKEPQDACTISPLPHTTLLLTEHQVGLAIFAS